MSWLKLGRICSVLVEISTIRDNESKLSHTERPPSIIILVWTTTREQVSPGRVRYIYPNLRPDPDPGPDLDPDQDHQLTH